MRLRLRHRERHLGHDRRARPLGGLDREPTAEQADSLLHADEPEPVAVAAGGAEALARRPRRPPSRSPSRRVTTTLTCVGAGVLGDVRQRLLDDPVERGLDLGRRGAVDVEVRLDVDRDARSARRTPPRAARARGRARSRRAPSAAARRRAGARSGASRRSARAAAAAAARAVLGVPRLLDPLQAEQDRRQRLAGLVVELAREPPALELLPLDHAAERVAGDAVGEVDGDRRARGERLGEPQLLVGEARVGARACCGRRSRRSPGRRRSSARTGPSAGRSAGRPPGRPRCPRASSRRARCGAARARGRSSSRSRARNVPTQLLGLRAGGRLDPQVAAARRAARSRRARRRSARAAASRSARAAGRARSRRRARSRPRSATRAAPASASPTRTGARSRSRPRPARRAA